MSKTKSKESKQVHTKFPNTLEVKILRACNTESKTGSALAKSLGVSAVKGYNVIQRPKRLGAIVSSGDGYKTTAAGRKVLAGV